MKPIYSTLVAPLLLAALVSPASASVEAIASPQELVTPAQPFQAQERTGASQDGAESTSRLSKSDLKKLRSAQRVLARKGYAAESQALLDLIARMEAESAGSASAKSKATKEDKRAKAALKKASKRIDARARKLLKGDINDPSVRVEMLALIADGYAAAGWESSEAALRFFVSASRTEAGQRNPLPMPSILSEGEGTVMDKLIRIVQSGEEVLTKSSIKKGAEVAEVLGRFYVARESARALPPLPTDPRAAQIGMEETEAEPAPLAADLTVQDLVTIEGRAPILTWAAKAFAGEDADPERHKRTVWIAAIAQNRVTPGAVDVPQPGPLESIFQVVEDLEIAAETYTKKGDAEKAKGCRTLAEYYRLRDAGKIADESSERTTAVATDSTMGRRLRGMGYASSDAQEPAEESAQESVGDAAMRARIKEQRKLVAELTEELRRLRAELSSMDNDKR